MFLLLLLLKPVKDIKHTNRQTKHNERKIAMAMKTSSSLTFHSLISNLFSLDLTRKTSPTNLEIAGHDKQMQKLSVSGAFQMTATGWFAKLYVFLFCPA